MELLAQNKSMAYNQIAKKYNMFVTFEHKEQNRPEYYNYSYYD